MAESREKSHWSRTAEILCILYNANRDRKKKPRPFKPTDFNPYAKRKDRIVITKDNIHILKAAFEGQKTMDSPQGPNKPACHGVAEGEAGERKAEL